MALLLHPGPVPLDRLCESLRSQLQGLPLRVWPDVGAPEEIRYALVSRIPAGALRQLSGLKLVGSLHAGIDHLLRDSGLAPHVPLTRPVPQDGDAAMSEYILAQVLSHHRHVPAYARAQRQRRWHAAPLLPAAQRTVGFLGLGAMAAPAAQLLHQHGFDVAAWARRPREGGAIPVFHGPDGLRALVSRSQILVNLLPLTAATENIVDAALLSQLPHGAAFVNVGRGEHVVDADLMAALDSGQLGAATLDVFRREPLPQDSPLWDHPGIVITPHACRRVDVAAVVAQFAQEVQRVERGEAPLHAVDKVAGY